MGISFLNLFSELFDNTVITRHGWYAAFRLKCFQNKKLQHSRDEELARRQG